MSRAWEEPLADPLLIVRCQGRRILAVMPGNPHPLIGRGLGSWDVLDRDRAGPKASSRDWGGPMVDCPTHTTHHVSGPKLRAALDRLARPGKTASVDAAWVVDE